MLVPFRRKRYIVRHQNNWPILTTLLLLLAVFLPLDQILEVLNYSKYNIHWRHRPRQDICYVEFNYQYRY